MTESAMEWAMSEDGLCLSAQSVGQSPSQAVPGTLVLQLHARASVRYTPARTSSSGQRWW